MNTTGRSYPLGAHYDGAGVNFAVFSAQATAIEICVFDVSGEYITTSFALQRRSGDIWHGYLADAEPGLVYGLRAYGTWAPDAGHFFDPAQILLDPYAREIVFDSRGAPRGKVIADDFEWHDDRRPHHDVDETVLYELHVRGFSILKPDIPADLRGSYAGLAHTASIRHLQELGITAVSLLPVHQWLDEHRLLENGLVNYWGYNTLGFFAPEPRLATPASRAAADPGRAIRDEFRSMVRALHAAGIEVIIDVVFNHTCEGDERGPTISWRGLDNASWYRLDPIDPSRFINDSGCGNTLNLRHPRVMQFVMDSLRYWVDEMHVDGFRFDLATVLARGDHGFDARAALLQAIAQDPLLAGVKCIAEPWDIGHDGYRLGAYPACWLEWNDQFRDTVRRYWITGSASRGEFARRLCGSSDIFAAPGRHPASSVNYLTSHDGFTLRDLVSYSARHNQANGEGNRDGHGENHSANFGVEGDTQDLDIANRRQLVQRAMLATVWLSQGTPMIAMGSELGHSQFGNNNAYCQDNEISWIDWSKIDTALHSLCRTLARIRRKFRPLGPQWYAESQDSLAAELLWLTSEGVPLSVTDWHDESDRALCVIVREPAAATLRAARFALLFNPNDAPLTFKLPEGSWNLLLDTAALINDMRGIRGDRRVAERSVQCLIETHGVDDAT
jgi:glycogen operon protein